LVLLMTTRLWVMIAVLFTAAGSGAAWCPANIGIAVLRAVASSVWGSAIVWIIAVGVSVAPPGHGRHYKNKKQKDENGNEYSSS